MPLRSTATSRWIKGLGGRITNCDVVYDYYTALPDLLVRSAPPLHKLSLINLSLPEAELLNTLALAGDLHTLSVIDLRRRTRAPLSAAFVAALCPSLPPGPLLLYLDLSSLWPDTIDTPDGVCATMLRARWVQRRVIMGLQTCGMRGS